MTKYIDIDNDLYPDSLKNIENSPKKIFFKGNINLLNSLCFSVIGSRDLSDYGKKIEKRFVKVLSQYGITIVSGMALGADGVAHKETLDNNGKTIAVLGSGFNHIFPKENIDLYNKIIDNDGLVITEYEDNIEPLSKNFPERNRIVSGLSKGVLVIEAKYRSGTSITVNYAKMQGKKVFALPRKIR